MPAGLVLTASLNDAVISRYELVAPEAVPELQFSAIATMNTAIQNPAIRLSL
jgi:hypothetical protein